MGKQLGVRKGGTVRIQRRCPDQDVWKEGREGVARGGKVWASIKGEK